MFPIEIMAGNTLIGVRVRTVCELRDKKLQNLATYLCDCAYVPCGTYLPDLIPAKLLAGNSSQRVRLPACMTDKNTKDRVRRHTCSQPGITRRLKVYERYQLRIAPL